MKYDFNGKILNIPDKDLEKLEKKLDISRNEAIQCWLDDNDYTESEEAAILTEKAKENIKRYEKSDKKRKPTSKERKIDEEKKYLLNLLIEAVNQQNCIDNVKNEAEFSFTFNENAYTVKLIKHRKPKN